MGGKPRALLIDDDDDFLVIGKKVLEREGLDVQVKHSAPEALAFLRRDSCEVIFCDVQMRRMNGIEFVEKLSAVQPAAERKVIMLTGDIACEATWEFIETRNMPYVLKPINVSELRKKIRLVLGDPAPGLTPITFRR